MDNKFNVGDKVVCLDADKYTAPYGLYAFKEYTVSHTSWVSGTFYVGLFELNHTKSEWAAFRFNLVERAKPTQQKEKEMTFKNMKFDVTAIAKQLNVEHEEASRIIQEALFEQGYKHFITGACVCELYLRDAWSFAYDDGVVCSGQTSHGKDKFIDMVIKPTHAIVEAEEQQEVVELNGKKYNKQELEKALSLLKPIE